MALCDRSLYHGGRFRSIYQSLQDSSGRSIWDWYCGALYYQRIDSILARGIPIGLVGLSLDIPLILLGMHLLGTKFGTKTILGSFLMSSFMMVLTYFIGEHDPLGLQEDILLSCIFGGLTVGLGLGLIFRSRATSGGSDIIAMILSKYSKLPVGQLLILVDSTIVLIGLATFKDWRIPLYSWIVIYITGKVIDLVVEGVNFEKSVFIISDHPEAIRQKIIYDLRRGGTFIEGEGMYNGKPRRIIHTVMSRREVSLLLDHVRRIDPDAFITVTDASEILGEGFKSLNE